MIDPIVRTDINIRSARYFLARAVITCWYCHASTQVAALALPPGHETLELDDDARDDGTPEGSWSIASQNAFLFYVEYIPDAVRRSLNAVSPSYRFGHSEAVEGLYWANHCEHCGFRLDDHELFCEPDGAFLPTTEASAGAVQLLAVEETFEAAAAGYAYEPLLFDSMSRG
jgi:hypothetical protein